MKKISVNIISGFLGSGKTTAIIRLLEQKQPDECWAIVINEFGKISIDGQTIQSKSVLGSVFEVSGGCICCSAKGYLRENLEKIIESGKYNRIIIEPSGLGGIDMVIEIIETLPYLKIMPVICMVDITAISNARLQMNMIYRTQIAKANLVVFSKCDIFDNMEVQDQLVKKFKTTFPETAHCLSGLYLSPAILDMDFAQTSGNNSSLYFVGNSNLTDKNYQQKHFQFGIDLVFDCEKLSDFFNGHPQIYRAKGYIQTKNGWKLFNFTFSGCTFEPCKTKEKNELILIAEKMNTQILPDFQANLEKTCLNCSLAEPTML